jgi:hypothetical protein
MYFVADTLRQFNEMSVEFTPVCFLPISIENCQACCAACPQALQCAFGWRATDDEIDELLEAAAGAADLPPPGGPGTAVRHPSTQPKVCMHFRCSQVCCGLDVNSTIRAGWIRRGIARLCRISKVISGWTGGRPLLGVIRAVTVVDNGWEWDLLRHRLRGCMQRLPSKRDTAVRRPESVSMRDFAILRIGLR